MQSGSRHRIVWLLALWVMLLAAGCAQVQVQDRTFLNREVPSLDGGPIYILGIDFDPPLEYIQQYPTQGVTLLVAVENRGSEPLKNLRIVARLYVAGQREQVISREGVLPELVPQSMTVYAFPRLRHIPARRWYRLEVEVRTPDGREVLSSREYTLRVVEK